MAENRKNIVRAKVADVLKLLFGNTGKIELEDGGHIEATGIGDLRISARGGRVIIEDLELPTDELVWIEPVKEQYDPSVALPSNPSQGDRYISTATANGWTKDYIYELSGTN